MNSQKKKENSSDDWAEVYLAEEKGKLGIDETTACCYATISKCISLSLSLSLSFSLFSCHQDSRVVDERFGIFIMSGGAASSTTSLLDDDSVIEINVRCSDGKKFALKIDLETATIGSLKKEASAPSGIPADLQRLIYKGKILSDPSTLVSKYDVRDGHTIHLVRGRKKVAATATENAATPAAASLNQSNNSNNNTSAPAPLFGSAGSGGMGLGLGLGNMNNMAGAQSLLNNPEFMESMLNSPMMQNLMNNPEIIRNMMTSNPAMQQILEANPHLRQALDDPEMISQMMNAARNPSMMQEMMRQQDRALANIESLPGGFNALQRMYNDVQEPMMNAAQEAASERARANESAEARSSNAAAGNAPLPNPWANNSSASNSPLLNFNRGASSAPLGGGAAANLSGLSGLGAGGSDGLSAMMSSPAMQAALQQMASNPQLMQQMMASNPMAQQMMASNPEIAARMRDPAFLRSMSDPNVIQAMVQMQQSMRTLQNAGIVPPSMGAGGAGLFGGAGAGAGGVGGFPLGGMFGRPSPPSQNPSETFATQLSQLRDMGFTNETDNIAALQAVGGNVNMAIERLLNRM